MCGKAMCRNCGIEPVASCGRCLPCYWYHRRHGIERPSKLIESRELRKKNPRWCKNCGSPGVLRHLRCENCDSYWRRNRKERPRHKFEDFTQCKNCHVPLEERNRRNGMCKKCYQYEWCFGRPRPQKLWGDGKFGWCECKKPANHMIDKFPLCDSCAVEYKKGAYS